MRILEAVVHKPVDGDHSPKKATMAGRHSSHRSAL